VEHLSRAPIDQPAEPELFSTVERILESRRRVPAARALLATISGIDASGKGYPTAKLAEQLRTQGLRIANINIDAG